MLRRARLSCTQASCTFPLNPATPSTTHSAAPGGAAGTAPPVRPWPAPACDTKSPRWRPAPRGPDAPPNPLVDAPASNQPPGPSLRHAGSPRPPARRRSARPDRATRSRPHRPAPRQSETPARAEDGEVVLGAGQHAPGLVVRVAGNQESRPHRPQDGHRAQAPVTRRLAGAAFAQMANQHEGGGFRKSQGESGRQLPDPFQPPWNMASAPRKSGCVPTAPCQFAQTRPGFDDIR